MGMIKKKDIAGAWTGHQHEIILCAECMKKEDWENLTENYIIAQDDIEDENYFCNKCHKQGMFWKPVHREEKDPKEDKEGE